MDWLLTVADVLVLVVMASYIALLVRPWPIRERGAVIRRERVTLLGRLRMLGRQLVLLVVLAAVGWRFGHVSPWVVAAVGLGSLGFLAMPVAYVLTPEGIRLGRLPLRRWTEFGGVARRRWSVRLQGVAGGGGMTVWLSGDREDDGFVLLLRQLVRGSYQGWVDPEAADARALDPDGDGVLGRGQLPGPAAGPVLAFAS